MWNRKELKERGKAAFKANYWRSVLVAFLLMCVLGSAGYAGARGGTSNDAISGTISQDGTLSVEVDGESFSSDDVGEVPTGLIIGILAVVVVGLLIALVIFTVIDALVLNPLEVGCRRFFLVNSRAPAALGELKYGFQANYWNVVKTVLLRDIFLFLWSLLLVVPGIIKAYSYRLVPYILSENPDLSPKEAITLSRERMDGNKWKAFVLDLSFIGWYLLSVLTLGVVGIFYTNPYVAATDAELYKALTE